MEEDKKVLKEVQWNCLHLRQYKDETAERKAEAIKNILNELERLQKEFEAVDNECSRLEQKEIILESENEHYKDLIYALETYYDITEEDLEKCVKEDR